jgi:hypothetical protein
LALKVKTTLSKPVYVASDFVTVPKAILDAHKDVYLAADLFFVNGTPFFLTISRKIGFTTWKHLENRKVATFFKAYKEAHDMYLKRGFRITTVGLDSEFGPLQALIQEFGTKVELMRADEDVPEAALGIRVVKERVFSVWYGLPIARIPQLMLIHMVLHSGRMLNHFPYKGGISDSINPSHHHDRCDSELQEGPPTFVWDILSRS